MCSGSYTGFTINANVASTQFTWTATGNSPDLAGFGPGNGSTISQQLFNNGFTNPAVTYTVTPTALGCEGAPGIFVMTVHPIPDVIFNPSLTTICTGNPLNIQLGSQAQPVAFSWTAAGSSAFINNYSGGAGTSIQQSPQNTGSGPETVTYSVTPLSNGCYSSPFQYVATIYPSPAVDVSSYPSSVCTGDQFSVVFTSVTAGTTFSWVAFATSPTVSGYSGGNGNSFIHTLNNPGSTSETVTYIVTPKANDCYGSPVSIMVLVKPLPDIILSPASQTACWGQPAQVTQSSTFPGAICSWTATGSSSAVTGYANGTGNLISQPLFTNGTTTQTVTYFISSTLDGCTSPVSLAEVLTYPVPDMTITPPVQSICSGHYTGISLASQLSGTTFQWNVSGSPFVTGFSGGTGNSIVQLLNNANNTAGWATYTITPIASVCSGPAADAVVNVHPMPAVSFAVCFDTITTTAAKPFRLRGGLPPGGQYSGPGVETVSGMFAPSASGVGLIHVSYSYTNAYGCAGTRTGNLHVLPPPSFTCGNLLTDVRDNSQYSTFQLPNGKCWMKENLDFGNPVSNIIPQTDNCQPEKYTRFSSSNPHPTFYQWDELMCYETTSDTKGICPPGWHVPSADEWNELLSFYDGPGRAAGPMKDLLLLDGFQSYQSGIFYLNNSWAFISGMYAGSMFWTSNSTSADHAIARGVNAFNYSVSLYNSSRENAFSLRCVHD